jgi:hypothetical protein
MGPIKVITFVPVSQQVVYFVQAIEPVQLQAFPSDGSVESLDDSVLSGCVDLSCHFDFKPPICYLPYLSNSK